MDPLILIGSIIIFIVVAVSVFPAMKIMPFVYGSTRVKAARGKIFSDPELSTLAGESYKEIVYQMEKRDFSGLLNLIDSDFREEKVQSLLSEQKVNNFTKLVKYVPEKYKPFFKNLLMRPEIEMVFMALRSKTSNYYTEHKLKEMYVETNNFNKGDIEKINDMDLDDLMMMLKKTDYGEFITKHTDSIKKGNLTGFEKELHQFYFDKLRKSALDNTFLNRFVALEIDSYNIRHALSHEEEFMLKGGRIQKSEIEQIFTAKDPKDIRTALEKTYFGKHIRSYDRMADILNGLLRAKKEFAKRLANEDPLGINQILSFSIQKEIELKNLSIIITLVSERFSPEEIRALLI